MGCGIGEDGQPEWSRTIGPDRGSCLTALVHQDSAVTAFRCCPAFSAPPPRLCKPAQMTMKTELNPHEAVPDGWPPGQISSRAFLAWAAEPATAPPAIHGARDAQLAMLAEPARVPACAVSRSVEPVGWAKQIELIRHGAPHSGLHPDARSCRIADVARSHIFIHYFARQPVARCAFDLITPPHVALRWYDNESPLSSTVWRRACPSDFEQYVIIMDTSVISY